ncbi:LysE family translocator [Dongia soli]|uniref:LysE family translocator n=1 Tax=Dongia soli TaxID=600628 RepID=A0ABU5E805_9PROT|nr:LysE family translocator [Dongia soli]MDY0881976.1 LysE family translocator [Dongia soli]
MTATRRLLSCICQARVAYFQASQENKRRAESRIDLATLTTYGAIVLGFVFIPGPATLLTIARSTGSGTKAGIATGLGIAAGDLVHTALAIIGLSALIATSALLFSIIKYLGAAYLFYLGLRAIFEKSPANVLARTLQITPGKAFRQAVLAELLNPKTALFFLAFLPQFVRAGNGPVALQLTILGLVFVVLGFLSTVIFALCAGRLGHLLRRNSTVLKLQGKIVGGIYCALGLRLTLQHR